MIITVDDIRKYRPIAKNIDAEAVNVYIREAERLDILPAIGAELYKEFSSLGLIRTGNGEALTDDADREIFSGIEGEMSADLHKFLNGGEYTSSKGELVRFEGLRTALCYFAYARFIRHHSINVTAFGVTQKYGDLSTPIDQAIIMSQSREAKKIGEEYLRRTLLFWSDRQKDEGVKPRPKVRRFVAIGD